MKKLLTGFMILVAAAACLTAENDIEKPYLAVLALQSLGSSGSNDKSDSPHVTKHATTINAGALLGYRIADSLYPYLYPNVNIAMSETSTVLTVRTSATDFDLSAGLLYQNKIFFIGLDTYLFQNSYLKEDDTTTSRAFVIGQVLGLGVPVGGVFRTRIDGYPGGYIDILLGGRFQFQSLKTTTVESSSYLWSLFLGARF
jgi:hypothetical protein